MVLAVVVAVAAVAFAAFGSAVYRFQREVGRMRLPAGRLYPEDLL